MNRIRSSSLLLVISILTLGGCATSPLGGRMNSTELLKAICSQGGDPSVVTGSVWAQVESPEMKGQFPATFRATRGGTLVLEITDLIGTPQAWLRVEKGKEPELRLSAENQRKAGGQVTPRVWAGLPLEFAPSLFLGKPPCPVTSPGQKLTVGAVQEEGFEVTTVDPRTKLTRVYRYGFQDFGGKPWVERMEYSLQQEGRVHSQATLKFMDPTDPGAYAKRWVASSPQGEIKVRWKDRKVQD